MDHWRGDHSCKPAETGHFSPQNDEGVDTAYKCSLTQDMQALGRFVGRQAKDLALTFTDLTATDLNNLGLTPDEAAKRLHVLQEGKLVGGVDAFVILWGEMPRFRWLARLVALPGINPTAVLIYDRILAPLLFGMHKRRQARAAS